MNLRLLLPLLASVFVFAAVLNHQAGKELNSRTSLTPMASGSARQTEKMLTRLPNRIDDLIPFDEVQREVLEGWPSVDRKMVFSRRGPTQRFYAIIDGDVEVLKAESNDRFLLSLYIHAAPLDGSAQNPNRVTTMMGGATRLPDQVGLHIDRRTGLIMACVDGVWQDYGKWRDTVLPRYREMTGFGS